MARPAGTHPENRPRPLRSSARVFRLGQMEFRRRSPVDRSNRINSHSNSPLAPCFSHLPDMMAAFHNPIETSHCLDYQKHLQWLAPLLRPAVAVFFRFSACGLEWLWLSEMRLPLES